MVVIAFIIVAAYTVLKQTNFLPDTLGVTDNMSYGFIFVLGLVAATSTCLAVAGGLLLAVANKHAEKYPHATGWQKFKPHIYFNIGRVAGYTILGALVGALGSFLTLSPTVTGTSATSTPGQPTATRVPATPTVKRSPTPKTTPTLTLTPSPTPTLTPTPTPTPPPSFIQKAGGPLGFVLILLGIILLGVTLYIYKKKKTSSVS